MNGRRGEEVPARPTFERFEDVQARCAVHEDPDGYAIESWVKSAKALYAQAQIKEDATELIEAFIFFSRTYEICLNGTTVAFTPACRPDSSSHPAS